MRQTSSIHPASSPAVFAIRNHTHRYREHSMTFTMVCTPRGSLQVAVNLLRSSAHAFICCFHETLTTSGTGSGNFLPDSNIILSQVPSLTSTPKFQTYRLPLYNGSCAWLERDGERSVEETFQRLLPWPQKMAGAASMASSEERQLDCGTAITVRCSARCCSLRFSVLTHTIALCSYQPFQKAFFSPLTFCSLWHVRSRGLQRSLQKWRNICCQEKKIKMNAHKHKLS